MITQKDAQRIHKGHTEDTQKIYTEVGVNSCVLSEFPNRTGIYKGSWIFLRYCLVMMSKVNKVYRVSL